MTQPTDRSARRLRTERLVVEAIEQAGPLSREDLCRETGLSRSAVSAVVRNLLADGVLTEGGVGRTEGRGRGRPSTQLRVARSAGPVVGIDFGHAHVGVAVAAGSGEVIAERSEQLDVDRRPDDALDAAAAAVAQCLRAADLGIAEVAAVAACIPGPLDRSTNTLLSPTIMASWVGLDPPAELEARLGVPVVVGNDADVGALGELRFGAGRGHRDFLYVKVSHGIGAGLVLDGRLYRGSVGIAGEIGHTQLPGGTELCRCGSRGCLETVVGVDEVRRQLEHVLGGSTDGLELARLGVRPTAARVLAEAGRTLGRVLADLCNCLNPAAIIVGGDLVELGELAGAGTQLLGGVRESIDRHAQPAAAAAVRVHQAALGPRAELVGAIAMALGAPGLAAVSSRG